MADQELAGLRAKRMAELQQQLGGQEVQKLQQQQQQQEAIQRENEMRGAMLSQIMDQSARARLSSIAIVKPEKAKMVESMLIQMAQTGQLPGKIGEAQLVSLLEKVNEQTQKKTTVRINRRRYDVDDDDDDY